MIQDLELTFSNDQTLAIAVGTALSTKSVDLGANGAAALGGKGYHDVGRGGPVQVWCQITATATSGGAGTLQVELVMADNGALTSNLVILQKTEAIALATLVAGYQFRIGGTVPPGITKQFIGLRYTVATADLTGGTISAGLLWDRQTVPNV